jgi:NACalpha-BTF3-like transcription factor
MAVTRPSSAASSTLPVERRPQALDEQHFAEVDVAMIYIEEARSRAERAAEALRKSGGDEHLVEALLKAEEELSDVARRLRQGTLFAVPKEQLSL